MGAVLALKEMLYNTIAPQTAYNHKISAARVADRTNGDKAHLRLITEEGLNSNNPAIKQRALNVAAGKGWIDLIKQAVEQGADINAQDEKGKTILHYAATYGRAELIEEALKLGADPSIKDNQNQTAMDCAIKQDNAYSAAALAKAIPTKKGLLPAYFNAVSSGKLKTVQKLVQDYKIDINAKDTSSELKESAIHMASRNGHTELLDWLADNGARINARNAKKQTAMHVAAQNNQHRIIKKLIGRKAYINARDHIGMTPLMKASRYAAVESAHILANTKGIKHNMQDDNQRGATHHVVEGATKGRFDMHDYLRTLSVLWKQGKTDFNQQNAYGNTPLHLAGLHKLKPLIQAFNKIGVNKTKTNQWNENAHDYTWRMNGPKAAALI